LYTVAACVTCLSLEDRAPLDGVEGLDGVFLDFFLSGVGVVGGDGSYKFKDSAIKSFLRPSFNVELFKYQIH
jgi:hypothetical protein